MTVEQIRDKRLYLWEKYHDIKKDAEYVEWVAEQIISDEPLRKEIKDKPHLLIEITFTIVDKSQRTVPFFLQRSTSGLCKQDREARRGDSLLHTQGQTTRLHNSYNGDTAIICDSVKRTLQALQWRTSPDNTENIFNDKAKTVYERLPERLKPTEKYSTRKELFFDKLNSSWRIATAGADKGRSKTLNFAHLSEIAMYTVKLSDIQAALGETLTKTAMLIYETTARGFNQAKDLWDSESCINCFYEWWRTAEYASDDTEAIKEQTRADTSGWLRNRVEWLRKKGIKEEQIAWYCEKYKKYLDKETIKQEYPCTPEEAFIATGSCYFGRDGKDRIIERIEQVRRIEPLKTGYFEFDYDGLKITNIRWVDDRDGFIKLYEEPKENYPYVIGGDTAGDGSDNFTGQVLNNNTGIQVAVFKKQLGEELYARQMYCLGRYYNDALMAIEINFSTYPVKELERLRYPKLYLRQKEDTVMKDIEWKYGFKTTTSTRPAALAALATVVREEIETINDIDTLKEMLTFIKNENGKPIAEEGKHDDLIMALAIGHYARPQQAYTVKRVKQQAQGFLAREFGIKPKRTGNGGYMEW